jgi:hypothetical protein
MAGFPLAATLPSAISCAQTLRPSRKSRGRAKDAPSPPPPGAKAGACTPTRRT